MLNCSGLWLPAPTKGHSCVLRFSPRLEWKVAFRPFQGCGSEACHWDTSVSCATLILSSDKPLQGEAGGFSASPHPPVKLSLLAMGTLGWWSVATPVSLTFVFLLPPPFFSCSLLIFSAFAGWQRASLPRRGNLKNEEQGKVKLYHDEVLLVLCKRKSCVNSLSFSCTLDSLFWKALG